MNISSSRVARHALAGACILAATTLTATALAQAPPSPASAKPMPSSAIAQAAGDSAPDLQPMARLSPAMDPHAIQQAMRTVADWQLAAAAGKYNQDWTYAPLYLGLLATSTTTGDPKYHDVVLAQAEQFNWKLWANRPLHADDEAIAQVYEALYAEHPDPIRIADARATFDRLAAYTDDPARDLWWWCDALFMAPAGLARMSAITGDHKYIDAMNREWALTQAHLYDPAEHLFYRDRDLHKGKTFQQMTEKNGAKLFWGRGNGWVLAGTANVLRALPANDPSRPRYVTLFREMANRIAGLQQPDGLWRTGLLDQQDYSSPEISASAFFTYAMAWGINNGLLDRSHFGPVVERAWAGMLAHVYADGRLGSIQPIGAAPGAFEPSSSYVYGVGGFLLTGAELNRYATDHAHRAARKSH